MKTDLLYLTKRLKRKVDVNQATAKRMIKAFEQLVIEELLKGNEFCIHGFLTLSVIEVPERYGFDPATQERKIVPAYKKVKVKIGDRFKDIIKNNPIEYVDTEDEDFEEEYDD